MVEWSSENCVRRPRPPTKIAAVTENRKFKSVRQPRPPAKMSAIAKNRRFAKIHLKIISSETAGPVGPKLL